MLLMWLMTAVLITNPTTPAQARAVARETSDLVLPVHRVPGPAFDIPCKVPHTAPDVVAVQLWVSTDGGKTWEKYAEIKPDEPKFAFHAQKPGEYLFAPRLKFRDGRVTPDAGALAATQKVVVEAGYQPVTPARPALLAKVADDLDEELTRLEFELIRKEMAQLAATKGLSQETADRLDRLRSRIREAQIRLQNRDRGTSGPLIAPLTVEAPPVRVYRNDNLIPPPARPVPVSPAPRAVR